MSNGTINKVFIIGNLGTDPEVRYSPGGHVVAILKVATTEKWKDQQGQSHERTEWHRIVALGKNAEMARDQFKKGHKICIEGRLHTRKWQDKKGHQHSVTEVIASELIIIDENDIKIFDTHKPKKNSDESNL